MPTPDTTEQEPTGLAAGQSRNARRKARKRVAAARKREWDAAAVLHFLATMTKGKKLRRKWEAALFDSFYRGVSWERWLHGALAALAGLKKRARQQ